MSSSVISSEPFKYNLVDGRELRLSLIAPIDWIAYADRFRTARKIRHTQTLHYAHISGNDLVAKLNEFDARKLRQYDVQQWVTELEGAAEMIALSLSRGWEVWRDGECVDRYEPAKRTAKDIPVEIHHLHYVEIAAAVANLKLTYPETSDPNPAGASSTETGAKTQTESVTGSAPATTTP